MEWCPEPPVDPPERKYVFPDWRDEYDDFLYQKQRDEEYERRFK